MPKYVRSKRWMQIVGVFYLVHFVAMSLIKAPIRTLGFEGALAQAAAGDPLARFLLDTWFGFGLESLAVGLGLLLGSRTPDRARSLIWTVIFIELLKGIVYDLYMLGRGTSAAFIVIWLVIHSLIIAAGLFCLRKDDPELVSVVA